MMSESAFIGIGSNPEGPDLPLGLGMKLAQDPAAMDAFSNMTNAQRGAMIDYIQGSTTGNEAKARIAGAIRQLRNGQTTF